MSNEDVLKLFGDINFSIQQEFDDKYKNLDGLEKNIHKIKTLISFSSIWLDSVNNPITTFSDYAIEKFQTIITNNISDIDLKEYAFTNESLAKRFIDIEHKYNLHCDKMLEFGKSPIPKQIFYCIFFAKVFANNPYLAYHIYNELIIPFDVIYQKNIYVHPIITEFVEKLFSSEKIYNEFMDITPLFRYLKIQELL